MKETVHVALGEATIRLFSIDSIKAKRGIRLSVMARLHKKFNVAVSEVRFHDSWERLGLAMTTVSNSRKIIDGLFSEILGFLEDDRRLVVDDWVVTYL